jgi:flavin reductase (DIM6/NTAB) family NADH-FMN oxidoreductase RutF
MSQFASGVTVITVATEGAEPRGMTATAFFSGSLSPPLCVVSVAKRARMHATLRQARRFAVNFLAHDQQDVALHFAGRAGSPVKVAFRNVEGVPVLAGALAHIAADLTAEHECGDHTLFVGSIFHMDSNDSGEPLLHHRGHFGTMLHTREDDAIAVPAFW